MLTTLLATHTSIVEVQKDFRVSCKEGLKTGERFALEGGAPDLTEAEQKRLDRIRKELQAEETPTKKARWDKSSVTCYGCGHRGHYKNDPACPQLGSNSGYGSGGLNYQMPATSNSNQPN